MTQNERYDILIIVGGTKETMEQTKAAQNLIAEILPYANLGNVKIVKRLEANPERFEIYGRVALTCQTERFEVFFKPLNMWMQISVYCPRKGVFAAIFEDISERKKTEEALKIAANIFDLATDSIMVLDMGGKIVNLQRCRLQVVRIH